ncbi:MAG TPA: gamma-glutamylcyclotransferase [Dongiaceae bacterium]|jgi:cation transport protein ChaC
MSLTPDLVALVHRTVADPGLPPGFTPLTDQDHDEQRARLLASHPRRTDLWLFAYGSLIWKPACEVEGQRHALLRGWHRKFCLRLLRYRGSPDCPGLMMALDVGGSCRGLVQLIPTRHVEERLDKLLRRETSVKPASNVPRWVIVETAEGKQRALTFAINRKGLTYCGPHTLAETADILAKACGHWGTGAEYLMQTVAHLEDLGIHDRYLWRLQEMVAQRIKAAAKGREAPIAAS